MYAHADSPRTIKRDRIMRQERVISWAKAHAGDAGRMLGIIAFLAAVASVEALPL